MLLVYVGFEILLAMRAGEATELTWTRYTFVIKGLEAVVFAAGGALFGSKVERAQAEAAMQLSTTAEVAQG
jgi:hypothetical protein